MDKFCTLYDHINSYIHEGCPIWKGISSHMLVKYHLQKLNLLPNNTKVLYDDMSSNLGDFLLYRTYVEKLKESIPEQ